jgi:hypothetical protein
VTLNPNGGFTYRPVAFRGSDSFSFRANDGALDSNVALATLRGRLARELSDAPARPKATPA